MRTCGVCLVIFRIAALLLKPVLADGAGVVVLAPTLHRADGTIGDQRPHKADEADHEETHDPIMPSSRRECNPQSEPVFSLFHMPFEVASLTVCGEQRKKLGGRPNANQDLTISGDSSADHHSSLVNVPTICRSAIQCRRPAPLPTILVFGTGAAESRHITVRPT